MNWILSYYINTNKNYFNKQFFLLNFRCIHVNTGIEMSEEYCDWTVRPDGVNLCTIACPGDCVLSGWSDWSPCPKVIMYT